MPTTTLTKVGNSMAVLLPKALRDEAGLTKDAELNISTPRKGVVVITALQDDSKDRLEAFRETQKRIKERSKRMKPLPKDLDVVAQIRNAKDEKADEFLSL